MLHVLALSLIAVVFRHPEMLDEPVMGPVLPTPLSEVDESVVGIISSNLGPSIELSLKTESDDARRQAAFETARGYPDMFTNRSLNNQDLNVGVVVTFCTFAITLLMVYGAVTRANHADLIAILLSSSVCISCISSLTAVGYVCYPPDIHRLVADNPHIPFQDQLLRLNPQCLSLVVLFTFMVAMMLKAYFIGVVWSCYKYLSLRLVAAQRTIHYIDPDSQSLLPDLPDYETAVGDPRFNIKKFPTPPPSYTAAVEVARDTNIVTLPPYVQPQVPPQQSEPQQQQSPKNPVSEQSSA
ncbi:hypothetical protein L9F63_001188 [Diploptera punctata]|uniref:Lysosomal-associated transmembrane protein 4A n=1 Tax=Diploptera punctata TaxID=6984 RepID=A0AAD8A5T5_DIPPU|nr:hypothetical protein L9F63_001188 [Diploptera punctata]